MLNDNALIEHASDIVADNVTVLPETAAINTLVYLTQQDREYAPGLYIFPKQAVWILISNSEAVSD